MTVALDATPRIDVRYRLGPVIGTGRRAVVRLAHDERLNRDVAVKFFRDPACASAAEVRTMAMINHPGVVQMYDAGQADGEFDHVVLEYVRGGTLRAGLDDARIGRDQLRGLACDVAVALAHVHAQGWAHGGVDATNVLVTGAGQSSAKLADLGAASRDRDGVRCAADIYSFGVMLRDANAPWPELLGAMTAADPRRRPTAVEVVQALSIGGERRVVA